MSHGLREDADICARNLSHDARITMAEAQMSLTRRIPDHTHPWLLALRQGRLSISAFWERVADAGTPLIEADPGSQDCALVTFLWRGRAQDRWVAMSYEGANFAPNLLTREAGTDVWHATFRCRNDLRMPYHFAPNVPLIDPDQAIAAEHVEFSQFLAGSVSGPDPLHRDNERYESSDGGEIEVSVLTLPKAPAQPWASRRDVVEHGALDAHDFTSAILGNSRRIWVYTPPQFATMKVPSAGLPWLLSFDGDFYVRQLRVPHTLDNLYADGAIGSTLAVFVDNATAESRNAELLCNESLVDFLAQELVPWLRERYPLSASPTNSFVAGASFGGVAALWCGIRAPHLFGNVIAQGASLWWGRGCDIYTPRNEGTFRGEWLIEEFERLPQLPIRIWLEVGLLEHPIFMLASNRRLRRVLESKGYDVRYVETAGGHDSVVWRGTLGSALAEMLPR